MLSCFASFGSYSVDPEPLLLFLHLAAFASGQLFGWTDTVADKRRKA
jgi:hypothetical protein